MAPTIPPAAAPDPIVAAASAAVLAILPITPIAFVISTASLLVADKSEFKADATPLSIPNASATTLNTFSVSLKIEPNSSIAFPAVEVADAISSIAAVCASISLFAFAASSFSIAF